MLKTLLLSIVFLASLILLCGSCQSSGNKSISPENQLFDVYPLLDSTLQKQADIVLLELEIVQNELYIALKEIEEMLEMPSLSQLTQAPFDEQKVMEEFEHQERVRASLNRLEMEYTYLIEAKTIFQISKVGLYYSKEMAPKDRIELAEGIEHLNEVINRVRKVTQEETVSLRN